jgi:hypothetical protein
MDTKMQKRQYKLIKIYKTLIIVVLGALSPIFLTSVAFSQPVVKVSSSKNPGEIKLLDDNLNKFTQILVLAHEMIHVKQYAKKELIVNQEGVIWKGRKFQYARAFNLQAPWEKEAYHNDRPLATLARSTQKKNQGPLVEEHPQYAANTSWCGKGEYVWKQLTCRRQGVSGHDCSPAKTRLASFKTAFKGKLNALRSFSHKGTPGTADLPVTRGKRLLKRFQQFVPATTLGWSRSSVYSNY